MEGSLGDAQNFFLGFDFIYYAKMIYLEEESNTDFSEENIV